MKLSAIIAQADAYVPNAFTDQQKADWLTQVNQQFFETVKVPAVYRFNAIKGKAIYDLPGYIGLRNIERVTVGTARYEPPTSDAPPGRNVWDYYELSNQLTLTPAPYYDTTGTVLYSDAGNKTAYTVANLPNTDAQAPVQYHAAYAFGLAELMALSLDDMVKASNYGQQFRAQLAIAQANYQRGGVGA